MDKTKKHDREVISMYFKDLYAILTKKLGQFALADKIDETETIRLLAMTQELIRVKKELLS